MGTTPQPAFVEADPSARVVDRLGPAARALLFAACLASSACAVEPGPRAATPLHVLLVAVGDEQPVFDRFIGDLARRFEAQGLTVAVASSSGKVGRKVDAPNDVYDAIRGLRGSQAGGCMIYLTGHGTQAGLSMPLAAGSAPAPGRSYASLRPRELRAALRDGCGDAPTVVVTSACYSGVYLGRASLAGPNRIVLTAAAFDRPSFGCGDDQTYTYYDGCFLQSLDGAPSTWRQLAGRVTACVAERERALQLGDRPSNPQSWFGRDVRDLAFSGAR